MSFRDMLGREPKRFVTEDRFNLVLSKQQAWNVETLKVLANVKGFTSDRELRLEFFFYTNAPSKAAGLVGDLAALGYHAEHRASASDKRQILVTGWTTPMAMSASIVDGWSQKMVEVGFAHDCDFDGWGTTPDQ